jgi:hypothetical protein
MVPIGVLSILLYLFGLNLEVVLGFIVLLQLYLAWLQTDVMHTQTLLAEAEYQPIFVISVDRDSMKSPSPYFDLKNEGEYPAFNVVTGLVEEQDGQRRGILDTLRLDGGGLSLLPKQSMKLLIYREDMVEKQIEANVMYSDVFGEIREATFVKFKKAREFWLVFAPLRITHGLLSQSIEDLRLLRALRRLPRASHRHLDASEKK